MWLIGLFLAVVPLLFIGVLAATRHPSRGRWLANTVAFGMVLAFMWATARWDLVSVHLRTVYPLLFIAAAVIGYRRVRKPESPPGLWSTVFGYGINLALIVLMSGFLWFTIPGHSAPDDPIDLVSPLRDGRYVVLHGGRSPFINGHARVRPQNHALDILGLNALGSRARPFGDSSVLEDYVIYGAALFSPCEGVVIVSEDMHEDLTPPSTDTANLAGNHVLIGCGDVEVLLAHMQYGSVTVAAGDTVTTDTMVGRVGNTGNTSEPHLHIHAERGGEPGVILDGQAVPITIDGRYLVRGSTFGS